MPMLLGCCHTVVSVIYRDYTDDACLTSFTAKQAEHMQASWNQYRAGK